MEVIELLEMMMNCHLAIKETYLQVDNILGGFENGDPEGILLRIQETRELVGFTQEEEEALTILLNKVNLLQEQLEYAQWKFKYEVPEYHETYEEFEKHKNLSCSCNSKRFRHKVLSCYDFEIFIKDQEITLGYHIECFLCGHLYVWPVLPEDIEIDIEIPEEFQQNPEDLF